MAHCRVKEAEEILDREFPVLNRGFVRLVDYLGSDQRIVQAARVSYGEGTKTYREDRGLIHYLLRNRHTSPFEQVNFTFHIKMPIFVARQWVRHRTARMNEISGRYSILKDEFYLPDEKHVSLQSKDNRQGRAGEEVPSDLRKEILALLDEEQRQIYKNYQKLLSKGIARELARINLPLSVYTEMYWQMDLHNLFHFLELRMHPHAQLEIREYAKTIFSIVEKICPIACEAFKEHVLGSVRFSRKEMKALKEIIDGKEPPLDGKDLDRFMKKLKMLEDI
ncbi:MAG: FAD-dependent thymidylate synthase [Spirochaetes bacterium]|nr:MAG: FAD-dependent thymidylate synthase [Spirochaetota bacterium]